MKYLLGVLTGLLVVGSLIARRQRVYLQSPIENGWQDLTQIIKHRRHPSHT